MIISCQTQELKDNSHIKEFKLSITNDPLISNLEDFISDIDFIPLETTEDAMVSDIFKIIIREDRIMIKEFRAGITIFDMDGKFINKICQKGKAPFQVNHLFDFSVSSEGEIFALDNGKLLIFNSDGKPLFETKLILSDTDFSHPINICAHNRDTIFLWHKSSDVPKKFHLSRIDYSGNAFEYLIPFTHFTFGTAQFNQWGANKWVITPPILNDSIYTIIDGKVQLMYKLNIEENSKNRNPLLAQNSMEFSASAQLFSYLDENDVSTITTDIVQNSDYLIFNLINSNKGVTKRCLINVNDGQVNYFNITSELESLFLPRKIYLSYNDKMVALLYAYEINQLLSEGKTTCSFLPDSKRIKLINQMKNIKELDNPVLMLVTLKDQ